VSFFCFQLEAGICFALDISLDDAGSDLSQRLGREHTLLA
jgi:hypothetical protein